MEQAILFKFSVLCVVVLALLLAFAVVFWRLVNRQQAIIRRLSARVAALEKVVMPRVKKPVQTAIAITKDEPISKYKAVTLPDDIQISFIDKEEK